MKLRLHCPENRLTARRWIASWVLSRLTDDYEVVPESREGWSLVVARSDGQTCSIGFPDTFFNRADHSWLDPQTLPELPLSSWNPSDADLEPALVAADVPVLFGRPGVSWDQPNRGQVHLDLFGSAFFMLSRYEEMVTDATDTHGRFPSTASIAHRAGFLERPIIDEYVEILRACIQRLCPGAWLKTSGFRMLVSHDVDSVSAYLFVSPVQAAKRALGFLRKTGSLSHIVKMPQIRWAPQQRLHATDPFNTFPWLMEQSERHGLKSAFYFFGGRTNRAMDANYEIDHPSLRALLREIHDRGHEIGLHPSYETYLRPELIGKEAERLRQTCAQVGIHQQLWGGRMHYLRWKTPVTMKGWEDAGMDYDSTLGFADRAGFRCGTCHEYPAYDLSSDTVLKLMIRPLIVMECSVIDRRYMNLGSDDEAWQLIRRLAENCKKVGGTFTLLWHNTRVVDQKERDFYESIISLVPRP